MELKIIGRLKVEMEVNDYPLTHTYSGIKALEGRM